MEGWHKQYTQREEQANLDAGSLIFQQTDLKERVNRTTFTASIVKSSFPQGPVFAPTLFLRFIYDRDKSTKYSSVPEDITLNI